MARADTKAEAQAIHDKLMKLELHWTVRGAMAVLSQAYWLGWKDGREAAFKAMQEDL